MIREVEPGELGGFTCYEFLDFWPEGSKVLTEDKWQESKWPVRDADIQLIQDVCKSVNEVMDGCRTDGEHALWLVDEEMLENLTVYLSNADAAVGGIPTHEGHTYMMDCWTYVLPSLGRVLTSHPLGEGLT